MQTVDKMEQTHAEHVHSMDQWLLIRKHCTWTAPTVTQSRNALLHRLANCSVLEWRVQIYHDKKQTQQQWQIQFKHTACNSWPALLCLISNKICINKSIWRSQTFAKANLWKNVLSHNLKQSFEKFLHPDTEADDFQNLIETSLSKDKFSCRYDQ